MIFVFPIKTAHLFIYFYSFSLCVPKMCEFPKHLATLSPIYKWSLWHDHFHLVLLLYRLFVRVLTARGVFPTIWSEFSTRNVCRVAQLIAQISWGRGTKTNIGTRLRAQSNGRLDGQTVRHIDVDSPRGGSSPFFLALCLAAISSTFPFARDVHMLLVLGVPE